MGGFSQRQRINVLDSTTRALTRTMEYRHQTSLAEKRMIRNLIYEGRDKENENEREKGNHD